MRSTALLALLALPACNSPEPAAPEPVIGLYEVSGSTVEAGYRGITGAMTVFDAALREPTTGIQPAIVRVHRDLDTNDPLIVEIDLADILERGDSSYNIRLEPGDLLEFLPAQD